MKILIDDSYRLEEAALEIYCVPNAVDQDLCEKIIECIDKYCIPSKVSSGSSRIKHEARKSSTCYLEEWSEYKQETKKLQSIISELTGLDPRYSEPLQGQKYALGDFYRRHTDFFTPKTPTYDSFTKTGGQRTWTTMLYLNDVINGGATLFPIIDLAIAPTRGTILVWNNLRRNGKENFASLHEALPPVSAPKYIVTQWYRQKYFR